MVVGGPNLRDDFHINSTEELFHQIEGDMILRLMLKDGISDITIKEGEMFLLPAFIPHSPQRPEKTIGFLVEAVRKPDQKDGFRWYCKSCNHSLYEEFFHLNDIEKQLPIVFQRFSDNVQSHSCSNCGEIFNVKN
jgi:3-hydroxyanthranilate 3,4-dioxygenase